MKPISKITAEHFRSLANVSVELNDFSVLVGPNGSGKSNLLSVLSFIRDAARFDIDNALQMAGGFARVQRQSAVTGPDILTITCQVTPHASEGAPDFYKLRVNNTRNGISRTETLDFKRVAGPGRRISVKDASVRFENEKSPAVRLASSQTSGLGTVARLSSQEFGSGPRDFVDFLSSIRRLDPDVEAARRPTRLVHGSLADDAGNLAAALFTLQQQDPESFEQLVRDLRRCLPGLERVELTPIGGASTSIVVRLVERGVTAPIDLADASFGTVRLLALLACLHDPKPPRLTIIEEVDHGLHPYALDVLVDRMRAASTRTQLLVASHSPTLVNRLEPEEIVVCDRDPETGASLIPAVPAGQLSKALSGSDLRAGELWFSGALGGVPA